MSNNFNIKSLEYQPNIEEIRNKMNIIQGNEMPKQLDLNSGVSPLTTGSTIGWPYNNNWYPYDTGYYRLYQQIYPTYQKTPWVSVEKAENGFIVVKDGKTYVCQNAEEIVKIISEKE